MSSLEQHSPSARKDFYLEVILGVVNRVSRNVFCHLFALTARCLLWQKLKLQNQMHV